MFTSFFNLKTQPGRFLAALLTLSLGSSALAPATVLAAGPSQGPPNWDAPPPHSSAEKMNARDERLLKEVIRRLELTPAQTAKVNALAMDGRHKSTPLRARVDKERHDMSAYLKSTQATEAGALARGERIHSLMRQLGVLRLKTWFAIRAQLTPAQIKKLSTLDL